MKDSNYCTDEGCYLSVEDFLFNTKCKIQELISQNYSFEYILGYYDNEIWKDYTIYYFNNKSR